MVQNDHLCAEVLGVVDLSAVARRVEEDQLSFFAVSSLRISKIYLEGTGSSIS